MSLILVDGSALIYRAHFAFANRPLTAPSGETTSVAFGFFNSILRLIEKYAPEKIAVVFDVKGPTFRHEMYPAYKAQRKPMPAELAEQLPRLHRLLAAWGIAVLQEQGVEADDVMATVARRSVDITDQVWFYTGDKDFMQLLDERTGMLKPGRRGDEVTPLTAQDVRKTYGLDPADLIDVFALAGDKADNIPGAPGVGDKTAQKLIGEFGSLEKLYDGLEASKLTPRLKRVLGENRDQVFLSRNLFVIDDDLDLDLDWDAMDTILPTGEEVRGQLEELGLKRVLGLTDKLASNGPAEADSDPQAKPAKAAAPGIARQKAPEPVATNWSRQRRAARGYRILDDDEKLESWLASARSAGSPGGRHRDRRTAPGHLSPRGRVPGRLGPPRTEAWHRPTFRSGGARPTATRATAARCFRSGRRSRDCPASRPCCGPCCRTAASRWGRT